MNFKLWQCLVPWGRGGVTSLTYFNFVVFPWQDYFSVWFSFIVLTKELAKFSHIFVRKLQPLDHREFGNAVLIKLPIFKKGRFLRNQIGNFKLSKSSNIFAEKFKRQILFFNFEVFLNFNTKLIIGSITHNYLSKQTFMKIK